MEELKNSILELEKVVENLTLREYLENVSLVSATDDLDGDKDYVKLMTIHNSKGLEFPVVFLAGVEDDIFPGTKKVSINPEELEEERRLCYVAITRAEEKLYMSYAKNRFMYGENIEKIKSRFIDELPAEVIEQNCEKNYKKPTLKIENTITLEDLNKMKEKNNLPFGLNEKVIHSKFGLGKIISINNKKITIQFTDGKREIALVLATKFLTKV